MITNGYWWLPTLSTWWLTVGCYDGLWLRDVTSDVLEFVAFIFWTIALWILHWLQCAWCTQIVICEVTIFTWTNRLYSTWTLFLIHYTSVFLLFHVSCKSPATACVCVCVTTGCVFVKRCGPLVMRWWIRHVPTYCIYFYFHSSGVLMSKLSTVNCDVTWGQARPDLQDSDRNWGTCTSLRVCWEFWQVASIPDMLRSVNQGIWLCTVNLVCGLFPLSFEHHLMDIFADAGFFY